MLVTPQELVERYKDVLTAKVVLIAGIAMEDYYRAGGEKHQEAHRLALAAALAAIDASGIAWVAPWETQESIRMTPWPEDFSTAFARLRDACLAERRRDRP